MPNNTWLKEHLDQIEAKVDKVDSRIDNIDITMAKQSVILEDHTRRSLANEEQVELLKQKIDKDLSPIKTHVDMVNGAFKLLGVLSTIVSLMYGLLKLFSFFN